MPSPRPSCVLLFSGKRKSGKDYLTDALLEELGPDTAVIVRLSGPLKKCYADDHGLDLEQLLSAGRYKERHRLDMIRWSEALRDKDPGYFCRAALDFYSAQDRPVWIVSDCRRTTDLDFFEAAQPGRCLRVRVHASDETRRGRGFEFKEGVDDAASECGLDGVQKWDFVIENEGDAKAGEMLAPLTKEVRRRLAEDGVEMGVAA